MSQTTQPEGPITIDELLKSILNFDVLFEYVPNINDAPIAKEILKAHAREPFYPIAVLIKALRNRDQEIKDESANFDQALDAAREAYDQLGIENASLVSRIATIEGFNESLNSKVRELRDALIWCSGASDFAPEGRAREGWIKICLPLLSPEGSDQGRGKNG